MCLVDCVRKVPWKNPMTVGNINKATHILDLSLKSPSNSWCATQSWEFCTKIVTSPTFYKEVRIFTLYSEATESQFLLSRLYSEIQLYHSITFLVSKFYFGMFPKLRIVSRILFIYLFMFYKKNDAILLRGWICENHLSYWVD